MLFRSSRYDITYLSSMLMTSALLPIITAQTRSYEQANNIGSIEQNNIGSIEQSNEIFVM